jgi:hypothetical protein
LCENAHKKRANLWVGAKVLQGEEISLGSFFAFDCQRQSIVPISKKLVLLVDGNVGGSYDVIPKLVLM